MQQEGQRRLLAVLEQKTDIFSVSKQLVSYAVQLARAENIEQAQAEERGELAHFDDHAAFMLLLRDQIIREGNEELLPAFARAYNEALRRTPSELPLYVTKVRQQRAVARQAALNAVGKGVDGEIDLHNPQKRLEQFRQQLALEVAKYSTPQSEGVVEKSFFAPFEEWKRDNKIEVKDGGIYERGKRVEWPNGVDHLPAVGALPDRAMLEKQIPVPWKR